MKNYIYFGEVVEGYDVRVLNEREARAGAGILFLFGLISFMNAFLVHEFLFTKIFVTFFMLDFIIRILINPRFSPSLLLGRMMVQNQKPEYVAAPQKKWAWYIGLFLSLIMFTLIVVLDVMTPIKIVICLLCLVLLFSEAAFGICIGCKIFNTLYKDEAKLCPGAVCEMREKEEIQKISRVQKAIIGVCIAAVSLSTYTLYTPQAFHAKAQSTHCKTMQSSDMQPAAKTSHCK